MNRLLSGPQSEYGWNSPDYELTMMEMDIYGTSALSILQGLIDQMVRSWEVSRTRRNDSSESDPSRMSRLMTDAID
jgi:hypothetical protein